MLRFYKKVEGCRVIDKKCRELNKIYTQRILVKKHDF